MSIIDSQWVKTWWFFFIQLILFTGFIVCPFCLQLFVITSYDGINNCNLTCVVASFVFFVNEAFQLKDKGCSKYFSKNQKIMDFVMFTVLVYYAHMRWYDTSTMLPDVFEREIKKDPGFKIDLAANLWRTIICVFLIIAFTLKIMYLMRINAKFGLLNQMIEQIFSDIKEYT